MLKQWPAASRRKRLAAAAEVSKRFTTVDCTRDREDGSPPVVTLRHFVTANPQIVFPTFKGEKKEEFLYFLLSRPSRRVLSGTAAKEKISPLLYIGKGAASVLTELAVCEAELFLLSLCLGAITNRIPKGNLADSIKGVSILQGIKAARRRYAPVAP